MTEKGSKQKKTQKEYEFPKGWKEVDVRSIKKEHEFPREYELAIRKKRVSR